MSREFKQMYDLKDYTLEEIQDLYKVFASYRKTFENKWDIVKKFHDGEMWKEIGKNLPNFFIKNDTNWLEYIEKAIKNSVYTGDFRAVSMARDLADNELSKQLNKFIDMTMDRVKFKKFMPLLGKSSILYNVSYLRVGWVPNVSGRNKKKTVGNTTIEHVNTRRVFLDPNAEDLQDGQAVFIKTQVNVSVLKKNDNLKAGVEEYLKQLKKQNIELGTIPASKGILDMDKATYSPKGKTITVTEVFYRNGKEIDQLFIANDEFIIYHKPSIKPNRFPIVALHGEIPDDGPYGTSMTNKLLYNIIAYNMMCTLENTYMYSSQNRAKIISSNSGINWRTFTKYGNDPHKTWVTTGDPSQTIRYVDIPELPNTIHMTKAKLADDIMLVSGVDLRYTGRDTGSIQTTGGTDLSQQRIISQTDNARISAMELFVETVTELVVEFYQDLGKEYPIFSRNIIGTQVIETDQENIDFNQIKDSSFQYSLDAAPQLPNNKIRIAQAATEIMESQAQYQFEVQLITPEEWLSYQDFPQKDLILARMQANAAQDDEQELVNDLMSFAGMIEQGMTSEEAIQTIVEEKQFLKQNPDIDSRTKG